MRGLVHNEAVRPRSKPLTCPFRTSSPVPGEGSEGFFSRTEIPAAFPSIPASLVFSRNGRTVSYTHLTLPTNREV